MRLKTYDIVISYHIRLETENKKNAEGQAWDYLQEDVGRKGADTNFVVKIKEVNQ